MLIVESSKIINIQTNKYWYGKYIVGFHNKLSKKYYWFPFHLRVKINDHADNRE